MDDDSTGEDDPSVPDGAGGDEPEHATEPRGEPGAEAEPPAEEAWTEGSGPPVLDALEPAATSSRTRRGLTIVLGTAGGLALLAGAAIWYGLALVGEERTRWIAAEVSGTERGFRDYAEWADGVRRGGGLRGLAAPRLTPLEARALQAEANALFARVEEAVAGGDWATMCELAREGPTSRAGRRAQQGLEQHVAEGLAAYRRAIEGRETPPQVAGAVAAALEASRTAPCGEGAIVRVTHQVAPSAELSEQVEGRTVAEILGALDHAERERAVAEAVSEELRTATRGALGARWARPDDPAAGALEVRVTGTYSAKGRYLTRSGAKVPGLALEVRVEVSAPSHPIEEPRPYADWRTSVAGLPESIAVEFLGASDEGGDQPVAASYRRAVELLEPHVGTHVRRVLGLAPFRRDQAPGSACPTVVPLEPNRSVRGTTVGGADFTSGNCAVRMPGFLDYDDGADLSTPEVAYRLVLAESSDVDLVVDSAAATVIFVQRECGFASTEEACAEGDFLRTVLEPGVHYVLVEAPQGDSPGPFTLFVGVREAEATERACAAATPLSPGREVSATTAGGRDDTSSSCGGTGAPDHIHVLEVPSRSRLRCTLRSDESAVLHLHSDCVAGGAEFSCVNVHAGRATATALVPAGRVYVVVDGFEASDRVRYGLLCELAPAEGGEPAPADSCEAPGRIEGTGTIDVDTFAARDSFAGSCGGAGAPDQVHRLEVATASRLNARWLGPSSSRTIYLQRTCGERATELGCAAHAGPLGLDLEPGTYYLVVDGGSSSSFGTGHLEVSLQGLGSLCDAAPLLSATEPFAGAVAGAASWFDGSCNGRLAARPEAVHRLAVERRSTVELELLTDVPSPVLYLRRACSRPDLACVVGEATPQSPARITARVEPGEHHVFVDGLPAGTRYELRTRLVPET